ncbi:MAG: hypothetical protein JSS76_10985 [Bacteroidetes bacterium]|nr:hypothetical protein [Bacteroidota bacterium]
MSDNSIDDILQKALGGNKDLDLRPLLEAKMKEYDLTETKVRNLLSIEYDTFVDMINGTAKQPSLINVLKLAQFLEISESDAIAAVLKNLDAQYISSIDKARKATFLAKNFDLKKLIKIGFLPNTSDVDILTQTILNFFGYESIYEYQTNLNTPLYRKAKRSFSDKMKDLWVASAIKLFNDISNPHEYDRDALKDIVSKIRPYSQDVDMGLELVCRALFHVGVTVIVQSQLTNTSTVGASFVIKGKPCIVLTDYGKSYPNLWITLLHELEHVLFDFEHLENNGFHISGEPDLFLVEDKAIEFSWNYFCDVDRFNFIKIHINNPYVIKKFADQNEVHVSILYWAYMHYQDKLYGKNMYGLYREYFPDYSRATKNIGIIKWKEGEMLPQIANDIKQIFELNTTADE